MTEKHIIFTNGRSGSNFIANTLNLHSDIVNVGEVLGEWTLPYKMYKKTSWLHFSIENYIELIYNNFFIYYTAQIISMISHIRKKKPINFKFRSKVKSVGVKDFSFLIKSRHLENWLVHSDDIKIIYLYRENILKRYLSLAMMKHTGIIKSDSGEEKLSIKINIEEMLLELSLYDDQLKYEKEVINRINPARVLKLRYEDYFLDAESIDQETQKIFQFLNVNEMPVRSRQKKINSDNLEELLENYSEVKDALTGTNYYKLLSL